MGNQDFVQLGQEFIAEYMNLNFDGGDEWEVAAEDVYCVWVCKALQNNKGLFSTDSLPGLYFEFTWNGDKSEGYLDVYKKLNNVVIHGDE